MDWSLPADSRVRDAVRKCQEDVFRRPGRKGLKRWAISDPRDAKTAAGFRDVGADWRAKDPVLCAFGYYWWGWAPACGLATPEPSPWARFGALQDLLLTPVKAVADAVESALGGEACDVGVHLRKADVEVGRRETRAQDKWVKRVRDAAAARRAATNATPRVFVAADPQSAKTKRLLRGAAKSLGVAFLGGDGGAATRSMVDGIRDALAENYVLASCAELLPREVGSSTFHDVAAARAAFERGWDADRVSAFVEGTKDRHPIFGPAFCAALDGGDWGKKQGKKGA